jgi:hypothetical protein
MSEDGDEEGLSQISGAESPTNVTRIMLVLSTYKGIPRTGQTPSLLVCFENKRALAKLLGSIILLAAGRASCPVRVTPL